VAALGVLADVRLRIDRLARAHAERADV